MDITEEIVSHQNPLGSERIGRLVAKFAIPTVISLLTNAVYNIVDQIFIGWGVGTLGNSATNVIFPLVMLVSAIAVLFGDGGATYMSLQLGKGEHKKAQRGANTAFALLVIVAILLLIILQVFLEPIIGFLGATPDNFDYAMTFGRIIIIGFPFVLITVGMSSLIRADGSPKLTMIILLTGTVINVILNAVFVLALHWGVAGSAWATVIGEVVSFLICIAYIPKFKTVKIRRSDMRPQGRLVRRIMTLGVSSTITVLAVVVVSTLGNNLLRYYGADSVYGPDIPLAAFGIMIKVSSIFTSIMAGIAIGCNPIFGFNYGAENYARVKKTLLLATVCATIVAILCFVVTELFPAAVTNVFGNNGDLYNEFSVKAFRIFNTACLLNGFHIVSCIFFQAIGKPVQSIINTLARQIVIYIPVTLVFSVSFAGLWGIAYAAPVADALSFIIALIFVIVEVKRINSKIGAVEEQPVVFAIPEAMPLTEKVIVTISRENGSGGRYVADLLAKSLGVKCYDKEIILETSLKSGLAQSFIEKHEEDAAASTLFSLFMETQDAAGGIQPLPIQISKIEGEIIREIAERESCVFVGRHSDYVLRERSDAVNVFVHAPLEARIKRVCTRNRINEEQAESVIVKTDKERARYYNYYTDRPWGSVQNYHLSVDTSIVGIEGAVEIIKDFITQKQKRS
jgi:putative MATE family efflux protein